MSDDTKRAYLKEGALTKLAETESETKELATEVLAVFGDEKAVKTQKAMAAVSLNDGLVSLSIPQEEFASQVVQALKERAYHACPPVGFADLSCNILTCSTRAEPACTSKYYIPACPSKFNEYLECIRVTPQCKQAPFLDYMRLEDIKILYEQGILTHKHLTAEVVKAIEAIRG